MAFSDLPREIKCKDCGKALVLKTDLDDLNRLKEWYSDPDGATDCEHACFKKYCYRCEQLVDKWKYFQFWNSSSIGLQKIGTGISICESCWKSMFHDWLPSAKRW